MTSLSLRDRTFLEAEYPDHEVWSEENHVCVVINAFTLAPGLQPGASDLLIRLPGGYPDQRPDMFWFADGITRTDGRSIPAIESKGTFGDRVWHRWSRHMVDAEWRSTDGLRGYLRYVRLCLRDATQVAA